MRHLKRSSVLWQIYGTLNIRMRPCSSTSNAPTANANLHVFVGIKMSRQHLRDRLGALSLSLSVVPCLMDGVWQSLKPANCCTDFPSDLSTLLAANEHLISAAGTSQMETINKTRTKRKRAGENKRRMRGANVPPTRLLCSLFGCPEQ